MPRTFYCVGLNYLKHLKEAADKRGEVPNVPDRPEIGYRAQNALIAHDEDVVIPATATEKIHYEGELVVVIGKKAKHLSERDATSCVFGYTIGNDVSERSWQKADRGLWRAKNADTFKPMGPWIETSVDLDTMETIVRVNGKESNRFRTNDMIFGIKAFIVEMTKYFTLWPGDVIWMGTDGTSPDLTAGDVVEIEITGIGTLAQQIRCGDGAGEQGMSRHSTAHHFLEGLVDLGVDYIFANLGTDHVSLIEALARWDSEGRKHPEMILCPHEVVAVHMAAGYALATGRGQAVFVHVDAGTANACMAIQNLFRYRLPVTAVCRPRALHAARRIAGLARYLCAFRAGPVRHRQHRPALRQMGIFAAIRHRGEGGAGPRSCLCAERPAGPGLYDAAARNAGGRMGRCRHAGLSAGAIRQRAGGRHRAGAGRCDRRSIDGGGKSDCADGLSRPQAGGRRRRSNGWRGPAASGSRNSTRSTSISRKIRPALPASIPCPCSNRPISACCSIPMCRSFRNMPSAPTRSNGSRSTSIR